MEQIWSDEARSDSLVVFVMGWACDEAPISHLMKHIKSRSNILVLFDFRDIGELSEIDFGVAYRAQNRSLLKRIENYKKRRLVAWSFGIWVAEQLFAETIFDNAAAFCGSPHPTDERYGIAPKRLNITIKGLASRGTELFERQTYGAHYELLKPQLQPRTLAENITELERLAKYSSLPYTPQIDWTKAIVALDDAVFPVENLTNYWGSRAEMLPLPHYPFGDAGEVIEKLGLAAGEQREKDR